MAVFSSEDGAHPWLSGRLHDDAATVSWIAAPETNVCGDGPAPDPINGGRRDRFTPVSYWLKSKFQALKSRYPLGVMGAFCIFRLEA